MKRSPLTEAEAEAGAGAEAPLPSHVYVPGQTQRHPETWFDEIKASVRPGMAARDLAKTRAFRAGLRYLEQGYFWECHEVLEAVWMQTAPNSPEREMLQALIQLANAKLKLLMARPKAALRLCGMVDGHLDRIGQDAILGVEVAALRHQLHRLRLELELE